MDVEKCLRCGEPYDYILRDNVEPYPNYSDHICSFDRNKEENDPFESGVVGRPIINQEEVIRVGRTYEHIIAGAHNNKGSKRIVVNMGREYKVYHNNICVHHSFCGVFATNCYNEINLKEE